MDKPRCRLCGAKHWSSEPHQFDTDTPKPSALTKVAPKLPPPKPAKKAATTAATSQTYAPQGECAYCDRRRAAQRELMRRRRSQPKDAT